MAGSSPPQTKPDLGENRGRVMGWGMGWMLLDGWIQKPTYKNTHLGHDDILYDGVEGLRVWRGR